MLHGLYKDRDDRRAHGSRRGVALCGYADGKMMGGNSGFAFIGSLSGGVRMATVVGRHIDVCGHNDDPNFTAAVQGRQDHALAEGQAAGRAISVRRRLGAIARRSPSRSVHDRRSARRPRRRRASTARTASGTGSIRSISACSTASTPAIPASWCCMTAAFAAAMPFRLYRRLQQRERPVEGRVDQSRAYADHGRAAGVRRPRGRHRLFRHLRRRRREGEATALAGKRSIRFKAVLQQAGGGLRF